MMLSTVEMSRFFCFFNINTVSISYSKISVSRRARTYQSILSCYSWCLPCSGTSGSSWCMKSLDDHLGFIVLILISNQRIVRSPVRGVRLSSNPHRRFSRSPPGFYKYHSQNVETCLDVAIFKTGHWGLNLLPPFGRPSSYHHVVNNDDGRGFYVDPTRYNFSLKKCRLHEVAIFVGRIRWRHLRQVRKLMEKWPVNNCGREIWNCRSWVLEILEELQRRGWLLPRERGLRRVDDYRRRY